MSVNTIWNDWGSYYVLDSIDLNINLLNRTDKIKYWGINMYFDRKNILNDKMLLNDTLKDLQNVFNDKTVDGTQIALQSWSFFILALAKENQLCGKKIDLCLVPFVAGIKKCVTHVIAAWVRLCLILPNLEEHWDKVIIGFLKNILNYSPKHVSFCITAILRGNTFEETHTEAIFAVFNPTTEHSSILGRFPSLNEDFLESKLASLSDLYFSSLSSLPETDPTDINSLLNPRSINRPYLDAFQAMCTFLSLRTSKLIHPSQSVVDQLHALIFKVKSDHQNTDLILKTSMYKLFLNSIDPIVLASQKFRLSNVLKSSNPMFNDPKLNSVAITPVVAIFSILLSRSNDMFTRFSSESKTLFDICISSAKSNLFALDNYKAFISILNICTIESNNALTIWNIIAIRLTNYLEEKSLSDSFSSHDNILEIAKFPIVTVQQAIRDLPTGQIPFLKSLTDAWTRLVDQIRRKSMMPSKWDGQVCTFVQVLTQHMSWFSVNCFAHLVNIYLMDALLIEDSLNPFVSKNSTKLKQYCLDFYSHLNSFLFSLTQISKNESLTCILGFTGTLLSTLKLADDEKSILLHFISNCVFLIPDDAVLCNILKHCNHEPELVQLLQRRPECYSTTHDILRIAGFDSQSCQLFRNGLKRQSEDVVGSLKKSKIAADTSWNSTNQIDLFVSDSPIIKNRSKRVSFGPEQSLNTSTQKSTGELVLDYLRKFNKEPEMVEQS